jgi:hypothetical protein
MIRESKAISLLYRRNKSVANMNTVLAHTILATTFITTRYSAPHFVSLRLRGEISFLSYLKSTPKASVEISS